MRSTLLAVGAVACAALGLHVSPAAAVVGRAVTVRVVPARSVEDEAVDVRVAGLAPGERVTLGLRSTDADRAVWRAHAVFVADGHGVVDTARSRSRGGTYTGVWPLGLIASMTSGSRPGPEYVWPPGTRPATFAVSVTAAGRRLASTRFLRSWTRVPLTQEDETVPSAGFDGSFYAPRGARRRTALLVFEGSERGIPATTRLLAQRFAADGYPALVLAYFDAPHLPRALENIPLEYFRHALQWLGRQPQVDRDRIAVAGISRGSEAALLLGVHYPKLVHGVLALDPSNHAGCGLTSATHPRCAGAAWTLGGRPIPYSRQRDDAEPTDDPAAVIPVERIQGPLLLACGGADTVWISCTYAHAILDRLAQHRSPTRRVLYAYPTASHGVGALLPDEPGRMELDFAIPQDERARERLWPHVLAFLHSLG